MKINRFILIIAALSFSALFVSSCKDENPTQQSIRVINETDFTLDQIVLQSNDERLTFINLMPDSTSSYQAAENIQSTVQFEILMDDFEISLTWELPNELEDILDRNVYKSGEYEFTISNIDTTNSNSSAQIVLSEYKYQF